MSSAVVGLETTLDNLLRNYADQVSAALSMGVAGIATSAIALHFTLLAFAVLRGEIQEPISKVLKDGLEMSVIATIALGSGIYQSKIAPLVQGVVSFLIEIVSNGSAKTVGEAVSQVLFLNGAVVTYQGRTLPVYGALWVIAVENTSSFGLPDFTYMFASLMVWSATAVLSLCCLLPWLLTKIAITMGLAVGPLFILLAMWVPTRKYFVSWVTFLMGNVFTAMFVAMVCSIVPLMFASVVTKSLSNVGSSEFNAILECLNILIVAIALAFVALQVSQIGAQLAGGGVALNSGGLAGAVMNQAVSRLIQKSPPSAENSIKGSAFRASSGSGVAADSSAGPGAGGPTGERVSQVLSGIDRRGG